MKFLIHAAGMTLIVVFACNARAGMLSAGQFVKTAVESAN